MAPRIKFRSLNVPVKTLELKRGYRLKNINISNQDLLDALETDEYEEIEVSEEERLELEYEGWKLMPSSAVKAIKLDKFDTHSVLSIQFSTGSTYQWITNAEVHYKGLLDAVSKGRYVIRNLYGKHSKRIN